jgi:hypothetical protein
LLCTPLSVAKTPQLLHILYFLYLNKMTHSSPTMFEKKNPQFGLSKPSFVFLQELA